MTVLCVAHGPAHGALEDMSSRARTESPKTQCSRRSMNLPQVLTTTSERRDDNSHAESATTDVHMLVVFALHALRFAPSPQKWSLRRGPTEILDCAPKCF